MKCPAQKARLSLVTRTLKRSVMITQFTTAQRYRPASLKASGVARVVAPIPPLPGLSARQFLRLLGVEVKAIEFQMVIQPMLYRIMQHNATNANPAAPYSNGASGAEPNHPDALL